MSSAYARLIGVVFGGLAVGVTCLYGIALAAALASSAANGVVGMGVGIAALLALLCGVGAVAAKSGY